MTHHLLEHSQLTWFACFEIKPQNVNMAPNQKNMELRWKSHVPPCLCCMTVKQLKAAAVLQLLDVDCCASGAFSQGPDKSPSLITNDNLTGATMHVRLDQSVICIHYVLLLFWVMKNWKVITTWKSILDNKGDKMRKSTINWSVVLVSTFKVIKAGNEIRQFYAFEVKQSIRITTGYDKNSII